MRLPDFFKNNTFEKIRRKMNIKDGYVADVKFDIYFNKIKLKQAQFEQLESGIGLDINLNDLDMGLDNTIVYEDKNVILYIRDQYSYQSQYKYHVSWCKTLREMRNNNKLNRYVISRRTDGRFHVNVFDAMSHQISDENILKELCVCKNCLTEINYKGYSNYRSDRSYIYNTFSLEEFLEKYDTRFNQMPKYESTTAPMNEYSKNWSEISYSYRKFKNWTCEQCGKNCSNNKKDLDVHHIDSNKYNTDYTNLKALCKECHSKQYGHAHYKR
ncbi:HNH endonuclease [Romboutsia sp.]|uniref:HNH endonuclease n=1 Tax=Romboutsia sp. TaxID=1965302 RepID=UPI003F341CF2